mmetsp:Transcript_91258/g.254905  ORF Transcript_91258/g.254905 Transcript_91258/m.254905 type:complete len:236 (-) Transcript_91258:578-1285(-)
MTKTPAGNSVSVEPAGYECCVGLKNWSGSLPKMQTVSELPPPSREKHMPTATSTCFCTGRSIMMDPASMGPHVMTRVIGEDSKTPSNSVSVDSAGYANCVGFMSRNVSVGAPTPPKPAAQIISEVPPSVRLKQSPAERPANNSAEMFTDIDDAPASVGRFNIISNVVGAGVGDGVGAGVGDGVGGGVGADVGACEGAGVTTNASGGKMPPGASVGAGVGQTTFSMSAQNTNQSFP